jgi:hypothetical protein
MGGGPFFDKFGTSPIVTIFAHPELTGFLQPPQHHPHGYGLSGHTLVTKQSSEDVTKFPPTNICWVGLGFAKIHWYGSGWVGLETDYDIGPIRLQVFVAGLPNYTNRHRHARMGSVIARTVRNPSTQVGGDWHDIRKKRSEYGQILLYLGPRKGVIFVFF